MRVAHRVRIIELGSKFEPAPGERRDRRSDSRVAPAAWRGVRNLGLRQRTVDRGPLRHVCGRYSAMHRRSGYFGNVVSDPFFCCWPRDRPSLSLFAADGAGLGLWHWPYGDPTGSAWLSSDRGRPESIDARTTAIETGSRGQSERPGCRDPWSPFHGACEPRRVEWVPRRGCRPRRLHVQHLRNDSGTRASSRDVAACSPNRATRGAVRGSRSQPLGCGPRTRRVEAAGPIVVG